MYLVRVREEQDWADSRLWSEGGAAEWGLAMNVDSLAPGPTLLPPTMLAALRAA